MSRYFLRVLSAKCVWLMCLLLLLSACASQKTMVVLVPDPGGKTGAVTVTNPVCDVKLTTANQSTTISGAQSAPGAPVILPQAEIDRVFARALQAEPKAPIHFILYFISNSNELRQDSFESLPTVFAAIAERKSIDMTIVGHTDSVGSKEHNYTLSKRRAEAVAALLVSRGVQAEHLKSTSHGEENPLVPTADNVDEPRNRRVEVVVR